MIGEGFKLINRDNIVQTFTRLIASVPNWRDLMKSAQREGLNFELAWRRGTTLDWITEHTTVDGQARGWAVISGMILKSVSSETVFDTEGLLIRELTILLFLKLCTLSIRSSILRFWSYVPQLTILPTCVSLQEPRSKNLLQSKGSFGESSQSLEL